MTHNHIDNSAKTDIVKLNKREIIEMLKTLEGIKRKLQELIK